MTEPEEIYRALVLGVRDYVQEKFVLTSCCGD